MKAFIVTAIHMDGSVHTLAQGARGRHMFGGRRTVNAVRFGSVAEFPSVLRKLAEEFPSYTGWKMTSCTEWKKPLLTP